MTNLPSIATSGLASRYISSEEVSRIMGLDADACWQEIVLESTKNAAWVIKISLLIYQYVKSGGSREKFGPAFRVLERVAFGQVHPETVAKFHACPRLLSRAMKLPLVDQERLASGSVELVVRRGGNTDFSMRSPDSLTSRELDQLLDSDHIRTREEQVAYLIRREESLNPDDPFAEACVSIKVMMTQKQRRLIAGRAKKTGISESEVVVDALKKSGII